MDEVRSEIARRGPADWMIAAEALVLLTLFRIGLAVMPVRRIVAAVTRARNPYVATRPATADARLAARRVQWAVLAAVRHSPFHFVCFPQALAGYTMLRRRNVPSIVVYGVARSPSGELLAHTWLMTDGEILLGGDVAPEFTAIERWS